MTDLGNTSANTDQILEIINAGHARLATFAKESFALHGRGIIRVQFPRVPAGTNALVETKMVYHDLKEMRRLLSKAGKDEATTLQMIETYDPTRQAVVIAAIDGGNPITIKMKLDPPVIVDGPTTPQ